MIRNVRCPSCGNVIAFDDSKSVTFCKYCGMQMIRPAAPSPGAMAPRNMNAPAEGNVMITYSTTKPAYNLTVVIDGKRWVFRNNARQAFTLNPGAHIVLFYVANRGWKKVVNVPFDGRTVNVSVLFSGRVKIYIQ